MNILTNIQKNILESNDIFAFTWSSYLLNFVSGKGTSYTIVVYDGKNNKRIQGEIKPNITKDTALFNKITESIKNKFLIYNFYEDKQNILFNCISRKFLEENIENLYLHDNYIQLPTVADFNFSFLLELNPDDYKYRFKFEDDKDWFLNYLKGSNIISNFVGSKMKEYKKSIRKIETKYENIIKMYNNLPDEEKLKLELEN